MSLLEKGQKIGLIASSDPIEPRLNSSLDYSLSYFRSLGLQPILGKNTLNQPVDANLLIDPKLRADDINTFSNDPEIKAVINLWGGYNSIDLLPYLDLQKLSNKLIIGASDFTTILNAVQKKTEVATYLWVNAIWLGLDIYRRSEESFQKFFMNESRLPFNLFHLEKPKTLRKGSGKGTLIGGTLETLTKLSQTGFFPQNKKIILVLEEIDSPIKQIKSDIQELMEFDLFNKCVGLILGNFSSTNFKQDLDSNKQIQTLITDLLRNFSFPIVTSTKIGHNVANEVLPIGANISIDTRKEEYTVNYLPKG